MKNSYYALLAAAVLASAAVAQADVVVGSAGAAFQTFGVPNENGKPFWDNPSLDGPNQNIGFQVQSMYGSVLPWWGYGAPSGNFDTNFHFTRGASFGDVTGTLKLEIAGYANQNEVGWYDTTDPTHAHHTIWVGSDSPSSNATELFTPSTNWGLYITGPGGTFYSNSALNSTDTSTQHFAVFAASALADMGDGSEKYLIGAEDLPNSSGVHTYTSNNNNNNNNSSTSDDDYNDFVFTIDSTPGSGSIPEPASLSILAVGGAGLLLRRRKK